MNFVLLILFQLLVYGSDDVAQAVILESNQYRREQNLDTFQTEHILNKLAFEHSKNMALEKVAYGHGGFDSRMKAAKKKFDISGFAENVLYCDNECNAATALKSWIGSKGHRKNLEGKYSHTGVGVYTDENGRRFYTQIFAEIKESE